MCKDFDRNRGHTADLSHKGCYKYNISGANFSLIV